jgi:hypothetical protein
MIEPVRLPDRRSSQNLSFEVDGLRFTATVSFFLGTDRLAEAFINNHRNNSAADVAARDSAILLSLCLQHGADVETIRHALTGDSHGKACGPVAALLDILAAKEKP